MKMILEVGSYHDNTPSQPSQGPKLTFTGFKTGFAPARAGAGPFWRACLGSIVACGGCGLALRIQM